MHYSTSFHKRIKLSLLSVLFCIGTTTSVVAANKSALKVCADPNFAPFSMQDQSGFENKIAHLLADELGLPVEYTWFPQRMGFIRNTLRATLEDGVTHKCDLVIGVPEKFELAITTDPYYRSTYALVYPEGSVLDGVKKGEDVISLAPDKRQQLRIGMTERSPGTLWLAKYGMHEQIVAYIAQSGDPGEFPGEPILTDLLAGNLDAAIVWGPTAGLFTKHSKNGKSLRIIPLVSEPGVKFDFAISAGVRFGEKEWKNQIDTLLKKNSTKIHAILKDYSIPLVDNK
ncbi:MAG: quinoprotein dehydrogenase-associated putative ABC transporter substrate-binding protein [Gammaproteobacteria bacterium]